MDTDKTYIIPIEGLGVGRSYQYDFDVDEGFFESIEYADFTADVDIELTLTVHASTLDLQFHIEGVVFTKCDRCFRDIEFPIDTDHSLLVKYGESEDKGDIAFIPEDTTEIDVSHYLYEFTGLSIPMQHTCADTERGKCPKKVRDILDKEPERDEEDKSSAWDVLDELSFEDD